MHDGGDMLGAPLFKREIDQRLYEVLTRLPIDFQKASNLVAQGASVNGACVDPDLGNTFLASVVYDDLTGENLRSSVTDFFLKNGFDPTVGDGLNGAQALTNLIALGYLEKNLLRSVKEMLDRGCDPDLCFLQYIDEPEPQSALDRAATELFDSWLPDCDFLAAQTYSPIYQALLFAIEKKPYQSIESLAFACGQRIKSIGSLGKTHLQTLIPDYQWCYEGERLEGTFSSGILIGLENTTHCIDPVQAAFCSSEVQVKDNKNLIDVPNPVLNTEIVAITGRVSDFSRSNGVLDDTINLIFANDYCLRIQENPNNEKDNVKRGTIQYKSVTDERSDAFVDVRKNTLILSATTELFIKGAALEYISPKHC